MKRRTLLKGASIAVATGSVTALSGCTGSLGGGGGASGEVTTNEFDNLSVEEHRLENTTVLGTEAVAVVATVENTGDEPIELALDVTLYDGDTIVGGDDATVDETIEPGTSKEISEAHEGRKEDVTRYEISITEQEY